MPWVGKLSCLYLCTANVVVGPLRETTKNSLDNSGGEVFSVDPATPQFTDEGLSSTPELVEYQGAVS